MQGCFEILKVNTEYKLSLLLLEKGDREAVDEEFFASSVSAGIRVQKLKCYPASTPSPAGEGLQGLLQNALKYGYYR